MEKSTVKYHQIKRFVNNEKSDQPTVFNICRNKNFENKLGVNLVAATKRALNNCNQIVSAMEQPVRDELTSGIDSLRSKYVRTVFENPTQQGVNIQFEFNNYPDWNEYKKLEETLYTEYGNKLAKMSEEDIEIEVEYCDDTMPTQFFPLEKQVVYEGIVIRKKEPKKEEVKPTEVVATPASQPTAPTPQEQPATPEPQGQSDSPVEVVSK